MDAVDASMALYNDDRAAWNALAARDMDLDVSWNAPAQKYMELFQRVIG